MRVVPIAAINAAKYATDLAKKYNGGQPWTPNPRALRAGRRFDDEQGEKNCGIWTSTCSGTP